MNMNMIQHTGKKMKKERKKEKTPFLLVSWAQRVTWPSGSQFLFHDDGGKRAPNLRGLPQVKATNQR